MAKTQKSEMEQQIEDAIGAEFHRRLTAAVDVDPSGNSATELAKKTGLDRSLLSRVLNGKRWATETQRFVLGKLLDIDVADVMRAAQDSLDLPTTQARPHKPRKPKEPALPAGGSVVPPGLDEFLLKHAESEKISKREAWYLHNTKCRAEPWVDFNEDFWFEMLKFWRRYLKTQDSLAKAMPDTEE